MAKTPAQQSLCCKEFPDLCKIVDPVPEPEITEQFCMNKKLKTPEQQETCCEEFPDTCGGEESNVKITRKFCKNKKLKTPEQQEKCCTKFPALCNEVDPIDGITDECIKGQYNCCTKEEFSPEKAECCNNDNLHAINYLIVFKSNSNVCSYKSKTKYI